jgi:hypothetical protein
MAFSLRFGSLQVEELRIRLAQFRRQLPQYGAGPEPADAIKLTGAFHAPTAWSPESSARQPCGALENESPVKVEELQQMSPQGYLNWLATIPLAESASMAPLSHMLPPFTSHTKTLKV